MSWRIWDFFIPFKRLRKSFCLQKKKLTHFCPSANLMMSLLTVWFTLMKRLRFIGNKIFIRNGSIGTCAILTLLSKKLTEKEKDSLQSRTLLHSSRCRQADNTKIEMLYWCTKDWWTAFGQGGINRGKRWQRKKRIRNWSSGHLLIHWSSLFDRLKTPILTSLSLFTFLILIFYGNWKSAKMFTFFNIQNVIKIK